MLPSLAVSSGRGSRIARIGIAAALLSATALVFSGSAAGQESLADLEARMETIQGNLDASTLKIERLRDQTDFLASEIARIEGRSQELEEERKGLMADAVARANELYRSGSVETLEVLFSSSDFSELADRAQLLSDVSSQDADVFIRLTGRALR